MATFYLVNATIVGSQKYFPGTLIDDATPVAAAVTAAGGLLWPSSDVTVAAAAVKAQNAHVNRGANEADMESIMKAAVDSVQKTNDAAVPTSASLASVATGAGAALVGIEDSGGLFTATTVEAALAEVVAPKIQVKTLSVAAAAIAALGAVTSGTINLGTALPTNARLLGAEVNVTTKVQNAGDTDTTTVDVGTSASGKADAAVKLASLKTTGFKGDGGTGDATGYVGQLMSAEQGIVTITSSVNLSTITAGAFTAKLFYFVLA